MASAALSGGVVVSKGTMAVPLLSRDFSETDGGKSAEDFSRERTLARAIDSSKRDGACVLTSVRRTISTSGLGRKME